MNTTRLCVLLVVGLFTPQVFADPSSDLFVAALSGLYLREKPATKAKALTLLYFGTRVRILAVQNKTEKIDGREGRWTRVSFGKREGWVFGGYLQSNPPDPRTLSTEQLFRSYASYSFTAHWGGRLSDSDCQIGAFGSADCHITSISFDQDKAIIIVSEIMFSDPPGRSAPVSWTCYVAKRLLLENFGTWSLEQTYDYQKPIDFNCASPGSSDYPPRLGNH